MSENEQNLSPDADIVNDIGAAIQAVETKESEAWEGALIGASPEARAAKQGPTPAAADAGRATPPEPPAGKEPVAGVAEVSGEPQAASRQPAPRPEEAAIAPPVNWKAKGKIDWNRLPRAVQVELANDYGRLGQIEAGYGELARVLEPRMNHIVAEFGSAPAFVQRMLQLSDFAAKDPVAFVQWYANSRGLDLASLVPQAAGQAGQQQAVDPQTSALHQRIAQLENMQRSAIMTAKQRESLAAQQELVQFFSNPKHVYANDLRTTMADLLDTRQAATLDEAYQKAMWLHPEAREQLVNERLESQKQAKAQEAQRALKAGRSVTGHPAGGYMNGAGGDDVASSIMAAFNEVEGRA